jgi:hypothetical protein
MCLPHGKHTLTLYLQHVEHAVHACLHYLLILFKLVVSCCISLRHETAQEFIPT